MSTLSGASDAQGYGDVYNQMSLVSAGSKHFDAWTQELRTPLCQALAANNFLGTAANSPTLIYTCNSYTELRELLLSSSSAAQGYVSVYFVPGYVTSLADFSQYLGYGVAFNGNSNGEPQFVRQEFQTGLEIGARIYINSNFVTVPGSTAPSASYRLSGILVPR